VEILRCFDEFNCENLEDAVWCHEFALDGDRGEGKVGASRGCEVLGVTGGDENMNKLRRSSSGSEEMGERKEEGEGLWGEDPRLALRSTEYIVALSSSAREIRKAKSKLFL
jgi:hypothetical protein